MTKCAKCQSEKSTNESFTWKVTREIIDFKKCTNCGTIIDVVKIKRPGKLVLKKEHGAGEIRFSENEKRNFASMVLSMLDVQNKLLAAIATGADKEEILKISENPIICQEMYKDFIGLEDGVFHQ